VNDNDDDGLHPFVDEMYSLGEIVTHGHRSLVDRSLPPDVTPLLSVTAGVTRSDQTDTRKLQLAVLLDRLLRALL